MPQVTTPILVVWLGSSASQIDD